MSKRKKQIFKSIGAIGTVGAAMSSTAMMVSCGGAAPSAKQIAHKESSTTQNSWDGLSAESPADDVVRNDKKDNGDIVDLANAVAAANATAVTQGVTVAKLKAAQVNLEQAITTARKKGVDTTLADKELRKLKSIKDVKQMDNNDRLANAVAAAEAVVASSDVTVAELEATQTILEQAIATAKNKGVDTTLADRELKKLKLIKGVKQMDNNDHLASAVSAAEAVVASSDVTVAELEAAQTSLEEAIATAENEGVDTTAANAELTSVEDSENLANAVAAADATVVTQGVTVAELEAAQTILEQAIATAKNEGVDTTSADGELRKLKSIKSVKQMDNNDHLASAVSAAEAVVASSDVTVAELEAAQTSLEEAIATAENKGVDTTAANVELTSVEDSENLANAAAAADATVVTQGVTVAELEAAQTILEQAIATAKNEGVDTTSADGELRKLESIKSVKQMDNNDHLASAVSAAEAVVASSDVTVAELEAAQTSLEEAIATAENKGVDTTAANVELNLMEGTIEAEGDADNLADAVSAAEAVVASNDVTVAELEAAKVVLEQAIATAKTKGVDTTAANTELSSLEWSEDLVKGNEDLATAVDDAKVVVASNDVTVAELEAAQTSLEQAIVIAKNGGVDTTDANAELNLIEGIIKEDGEVDNLADAVAAAIVAATSSDVTVAKLEVAQTILEHAIAVAKNNGIDTTAANAELSQLESTKDSVQTNENIADLNNAVSDATIVITSSGVTFDQLKAAQTNLEQAIATAKNNGIDTRVAASELESVSDAIGQQVNKVVADITSAIASVQSTGISEAKTTALLTLQVKLRREIGEINGTDAIKANAELSIVGDLMNEIGRDKSDLNKYVEAANAARAGVESLDAIYDAINELEDAKVRDRDVSNTEVAAADSAIKNAKYQLQLAVLVEGDAEADKVLYKKGVTIEELTYLSHSLFMLGITASEAGVTVSDSDFEYEKEQEVENRISAIKQFNSEISWAQTALDYVDGDLNFVLYNMLSTARLFSDDIDEAVNAGIKDIARATSMVQQMIEVAEKIAPKVDAKSFDDYVEFTMGSYC